MSASEAGLLTLPAQRHHSGGTVRDSHPLPYSPALLHALRGHPGRLKGKERTRDVSTVEVVCHLSFVISHCAMTDDMTNRDL